MKTDNHRRPILWRWSRILGLVALLASGCNGGGGGAPALDCETDADCFAPPADACRDGETLRRYNPLGTCEVEGSTCSYAFTDITCQGECSDGGCVEVEDPCATVTCDAPPDPACANPGTLRTHTGPGTCADGECSYPFTETGCPHGCEDGACLSDACAGVVCDTPPPTTCADAGTLRTYASPGTCSAGSCEYASTDQDCPLGCSQGRCRQDSGFTPLSLFRFLDTRGGDPLGADSSMCVEIAGTPGIPASAKAVAINLVAVAPSGPGFMTAYPGGAPPPDTSTLNYAAGQTIANGAIVEVGDGGEICVYSLASAHVIIDVSGFFDADSSYDPTGPFRRVDTRQESLPASGSTQCHQVAGRDGIPADAAAVVINLTAVNPTGPGHLIAFPQGQDVPEASTLNHAGGQTIANGAIVGVGEDGGICVHVATASNYLVDVAGYFEPDAAYVPVAPFRRLDTRDSGLPAADSTRCLKLTGRDGIPDTAKAVAINVVAVAAQAVGHVTVYPDGQQRPETSTVNYQAGSTVANNAIVLPGQDGKVCFYTLARTHLVVDVVGYFQRSVVGDPCAQVTCDSPPLPVCVGGTELVSYAGTGTCLNGTCTYDSSAERCPAWCTDGACEPTWGWDYNLTRRCARSPVPGAQNYYEDTPGCAAPDRNWTITVQAEKEFQNSCVGPDTQSLPINEGGGLGVQWVEHADEFGRPNWQVILKTDFATHPHPCGAGAYTWFAFMDHWGLGGGPLPKPDRTVFRARVWYDDWAPNGAARLSAFYSGGWDGKGVIVEIDLASNNWDDAFPNVPDIVQALDSPAFQWVEMDGTAMGLGIDRQQETAITIRWDQIIPSLVARGYLVGPTGGWDTADTSSCAMSTETRNDAASGSVSAELRITDFRVSAE